MTGKLHRPALLNHVFFAAEHALAPETAARTALTALWNRAAARGMDREVAPHWPKEPPAATGARTYTERLTVLAARQEVVPGGFHQALIYRLHDAVGVSVLQAPNDDAVGWGDLHDSWQEDVGTLPAAGVLGTATLYLGLWSDRERRRLRRSSPAGPEAVGRELRDLLPAGGGADWSGCWFRQGRESLVWELPARDDLAVPLARRLLAITSESGEDALDRWLWSGGTPGLPPFTRYLLHAAKLRYQHAVLTERLPHIRDALDGADAECAELTTLLNGDMVEIDRLLAADRALSRLQTEQNGLIALLTGVRDMARTVEIAEANMASALGGRPPSAPGGPIDNDRQSARWMREQLLAEETYLESARAKAGEVARIAAAEVGSRLQQRQENLSLLQTTLLGALLTVLAGIQSLQYRVPLPGPLIAPLVCLLGTLALLLPSMAFHWPRSSSGRGRWRWTDVLFAGFFGATAGWFTATAAAVYLWRDQAAPPVSSLIAAGAGAAVATGLGLLRSTRPPP